MSIRFEYLMPSSFDLSSFSPSVVVPERFGERNLCWLSKLFLFFRRTWDKKNVEINLKFNLNFSLFSRFRREIVHEHDISSDFVVKKKTYKFLFDARHPVIIIPDELIPLPSSVPLGLFSSQEIIRELPPLCKLCCSDDCLWWWCCCCVCCCMWPTHSHETFGMFKLCDVTLRFDVGT